MYKQVAVCIKWFTTEIFTFTLSWERFVLLAASSILLLFLVVVMPPAYICSSIATVSSGRARDYGQNIMQIMSRMCHYIHLINNMARKIQKSNQFEKYQLRLKFQTQMALSHAVFFIRISKFWLNLHSWGCS